MSEPRNPDEAPETGAGMQGFDGVSGAYRRASGEEPPPHLDDAILAASRRAVQAGPGDAGRRFPGTWIGSVSIAAVIVLGVTVTLRIYREAEHPGIPAPSQVDETDKSPAYEVSVGRQRDGSGPAPVAPAETETMGLSGSMQQLREDAASPASDVAKPGNEPLRSEAQADFRKVSPALAEPDTAPAMKRMIKREMVEDQTAAPDVTAREARAQSEYPGFNEPAVAGAESGGIVIEKPDELAEIARLWNDHREPEALAALRTYLDEHPEIATSDLEARLPKELIARILGDSP